MKILNKNILTLVATGFLFIALFDGLPYGYFTFLRFVVCAVGIYLAYKIYQEKKESLWVWAFSGIAVLFNPFVVIHLEREQWWVIDLIVAIFFVLSIFLIGNDNSEQLNKIKDWKQRTSTTRAVLYLYGAIAIVVIILLLFNY